MGCVGCEVVGTDCIRYANGGRKGEEKGGKGREGEGRGGKGKQCVRYEGRNGEGGNRREGGRTEGRREASIAELTSLASPKPSP